MKPLDATRALDETVVIALGSDLAGAYPTVEALLGRRRSPPCHRVGVTVLARSSWWRFRPRGPIPPSPAFLNGVVLVETQLSAPALLAALADLEQDFGT